MDLVYQDTRTLAGDMILIDQKITESSGRIIFKAEGSLDGEPDFAPLNQDFELLGTGQSSQFSMINGNVTSSKTFTLTVSPWG